MAIGGYGSPRIAELEKKLKKEPSSLIFVQLAEEYRRVGEGEQAIRICREGLQKHPNHISANMLLGRVFFELRRYPESKVELERVIATSPENLMAHRMLGDVAWLEENWEVAEKRYRMVYVLNPSDAECSHRLRIVEEKLRAARAPSAVSSGVQEIGAVAPGELVAVPGVDEPLLDIQSYGEPEEPAAAEEPPAEEEGAAPLEASAPGLDEVLAPGLEAAPPPPPLPPPVLPVALPPMPDLDLEALAAKVAAPIETNADRTTAYRPISLAPQPGVPSAQEESAPSVDEQPPHVVAEPAAVEEAQAAHPPAAIEDATTHDYRRPTRSEATTSPELVTQTLADLYASQGYYDRAIEIYGTMLGRSPGDSSIEERIREMKARIEAGRRGGPLGEELTAEEKVAILQRWLGTIRLSRMPVVPPS